MKKLDFGVLETFQRLVLRSVCLSLVLFLVVGAGMLFEPT